MKALLVLAVLAVAHAQMVFPGKTWIRQTPEQQGFDSAKLKAATDYAGRGGLETYCVSVHRNGYLVRDAYWVGSNYSSVHIIWSTSKAWTATLIGTAERDGKLSTNDLMTKYVPEWKTNPKIANLTMDMVMRHCSGRYYDPVTDFVTPQTQTDQTAFAIGLSQQHAPGTKDQYNQMAYQTLQRVYETATGTPIQTASQKEFYGPMQFESATYWQMKGFFVGTPQKYPLVYGGVTTSCADLGRFGHLWLNQGNWAGKTVFTRDFYNKSLSQPKMSFGNARRYGNWGAGPSVKSQGLGNQIVVFNPTNGVVLTRVGSASTVAFKSGEFIDMVMQSIKDPEMRGNMEDWIVAESISE